MKMVSGSNQNGEMELPAADSCGLSEGEEDEQFDAVHFKESKGKNLLHKLKNIRGKNVSAWWLTVEMRGERGVIINIGSSCYIFGSKSILLSHVSYFTVPILLRHPLLNLWLN